jgi:hypothetical protein
MIESNENTAIVDYTFRVHGNKCDGTILIRCEPGSEQDYLEKTARLSVLKVVGTRKIR